MSNHLLEYLIGAAVVSNLTVVWFYTTLPVHLYELFSFGKKDKLYTREEWETHAVLNWGYLGELLNCPLCFSTHASWITGIAIWQIMQSSPWLILLGTFSWPLISYIFYKKLK
tara:strand:- start:762 stop:1100 length:339 start_codon:yes stop_codon:yes gene_type:complete